MPTITERSLINMSGSLVMTIPKGWVRFYRLKAGDKVMVVADEELLVKPKARRKRNKARS